MNRRNAFKNILLLGIAPAFVKVDMLMKLKPTRSIRIVDNFMVTQYGDIRYIGNGSNYSVLEFYEYLTKTFDEENKLNVNCIVKKTNHIISLKKPYNIDDKTAKHLYDGSLMQEKDVVYTSYFNYGI